MAAVAFLLAPKYTEDLGGATDLEGMKSLAIASGYHVVELQRTWGWNELEPVIRSESTEKKPTHVLFYYSGHGADGAIQLAKHAEAVTFDKIRDACLSSPEIRCYWEIFDCCQAARKPLPQSSSGQGTQVLQTVADMFQSGATTYFESNPVQRPSSVHFFAAWGNALGNAQTGGHFTRIFLRACRDVIMSDPKTKPRISAVESILKSDPDFREMNGLVISIKKTDDPFALAQVVYLAAWAYNRAVDDWNRAVDDWNFTSAIQHSQQLIQLKEKSISLLANMEGDELHQLYRKKLGLWIRVKNDPWYLAIIFTMITIIVALVSISACLGHTRKNRGHDIEKLNLEKNEMTKRIQTLEAAAKMYGSCKADLSARQKDLEHLGSEYETMKDSYETLSDMFTQSREPQMCDDNSDCHCILTDKCDPFPISISEIDGDMKWSTKVLLEPGCSPRKPVRVDWIEGGCQTLSEEYDDSSGRYDAVVRGNGACKGKLQSKRTVGACGRLSSP